MEVFFANLSRSALEFMAFIGIAFIVYFLKEVLSEVKKAGESIIILNERVGVIVERTDRHEDDIKTSHEKITELRIEVEKLKKPGA